MRDRGQTADDRMGDWEVGRLAIREVGKLMSS